MANRDIVITLDEGNRLSDEDQRILGSIAAKPPKRVRLVVGWSTAVTESLLGLGRLRQLDCPEITIGGLSRSDVERWLATHGLGDYIDDVYALTDGYPLLVEGLIAHLRSGRTIDRYSASSRFNGVLDEALTRLPAQANQAARRLSAFTYPLPEEQIPPFLGVDVIAWGTIRSALEYERVFSVRYPEGTWFHEARRSYLWQTVLTEPERNQVGQAAYSALLENHRSSATSGKSAGLFRPLAALAPYALESQAANPNLATVIAMSRAQLAVLAAVIELENVRIGSPTPADQVVIHAHTAFGAGRAEAIDVLPELAELNLIDLKQVPRADMDRSEAIVELCIDDECDVVVRGRIQAMLGKAAVPQLANHIVHAHLERVRLESYRIITQASDADALDVLRTASMVRNPFSRIGDPLLAVWLRYGDQPVTVIGVFNRNAERAAAEHEIVNLSGTSFGRALVVDRTFRDPTHTIPSRRFIRAVYFATGICVETDGKKVWLHNSTALPMEEFAQRQVDFLELLCSETDELEREVYGLARPRGVAIARRDNTEYRLDVRGAARAYTLDAEQVEAALAHESLISARLELALQLPADVATGNLTTQRWNGERVHDPVVELVDALHQQAAEFNARQPRIEVPLQTPRLQQEIRNANVRDQRLARRLSETITVGDRRGRRPLRAVRLAIHTHGPADQADQPTRRAAVCALPNGDPEDVQIKYVSDETLDSPDAVYAAAFGPDEDATDLHANYLQPLVAELLGFSPADVNMLV